MTLLMIVFWAAVITAVVLAVRYLADSRHPGGAPHLRDRHALRTSRRNGSLAARSTMTSIGSA